MATIEGEARHLNLIVVALEQMKRQVPHLAFASSVTSNEDPNSCRHSRLSYANLKGFCYGSYIQGSVKACSQKFPSGEIVDIIVLEPPHVNILSNMDLVTKKKDLQDYLNPKQWVSLSELNQHMAPSFAKLNKALTELVDDFSMVNFVPLDLRKKAYNVLSYIGNYILCGEDADVKLMLSSA
ncbi:GPN-loop GTPase 3-like [Elaeis guineensis]|uniref:GPN-loop GTPase 3-like n=1 Tax=Elaeis guineensis var. tenera TaxID=51953 RepID=UPI003C6D4FCE